MTSSISHSHRPTKRQRQQKRQAVPGLAVRQWSALYSEHWPHPSGRDRRGTVPNESAHTMDFPTAGEVSSATHRTHPDNRSCRRIPRFRSLPLGGKRLSDRGHNPQPPRCRPHMDTGRGRTNRSPGNAARSCRQLRPKARCSQEVELRRTILSHVFRSWSNAPTELQSPAWTTTRRGKVAQAVIFCRILPAFGGLCLKWSIDSEVHAHPTSPKTNGL